MEELNFERTKNSAEEVQDLEREIEEAVDAALAEEIRQLDADLRNRRLLHTGSVMLNLACANKALGGFPVGAMANVIGDSFAGKTLLALTMLAQAVYDKSLDKYELYYDDVERRFMFDEEMFGPDFVKRVKEPPNGHSDTIFDWYVNLEKLFEKGKPFIYVLDSLDALAGGDEEKRLKRLADGKSEGGYGTVKPKTLSEMLRTIRVKLKDTMSFVLIISQVRENLDPGSFERYRRSGGKALKFYCTHEVWITRAEVLKKTVKGLTREIGAKVKAKIKKNSLTGKPREVGFVILHDYGVDDIWSVTEFLASAGVFKKKKNDIVAEPFEFEGTLQKFISFIEEDPERERKLYVLAEDTWNEIEAACRPKRRPKFRKA